MSPRAAAIGLLALAALGRLALYWGRPGAPPGEVLAAPRPAVSPTRQRDSAARAAAPLAPGERVDVDRANAGALARLPGIGPGLARRIVADREARGAFGGLEGLDRVPGIGPALLERIRPWVTFSGTPPGAEVAPNDPGLLLLPGERLLMAPDTVPGSGTRRRRRPAAPRLP